MKKENDEKLTKLQAFLAMTEFLEDYYQRTSDVGSLLGDMRILQDGDTADSAAWYDWTESVKKGLKNKASNE